MYTDKEAQFSASQEFTATAVGDNKISLSSARSIGNGEPMVVAFVVDVDAVQATGDESYTFAVEYATDEAQTLGLQEVGRRTFQAGTPTGSAQNASLLTSGFKFAVPVPPTSLAESAEVIGIRGTLGGTTPGVTVSAYLMPQSMYDSSGPMYPSGYSIL